VLDLHCHLLPGVDDGPPSYEESEALARQMVAEGVSAVAATPHCRADHPAVVPEQLAERCAHLERRFERAGLELRVLPAGEVDLLWGLEASDEDLRLASYCQRGTDLLVETPYGPLTSNFESLLFGLGLKGYRILLAHPERNPTFQQDFERLAELLRRGTLVQVTASSLARSPKGSRSATLAHRLVREGLATVISSDAHGPIAPNRASLRAGAEAAIELVGRPLTRWMVRDAPRAIVAGEALPEAPAPPPEKRSLLRRLTG
jgi:protein-tyrosine phosphatase